MKVILLKELKGKGVPWDVVDVAPGFANNYLLPQRIALRCTEGNLRALKEIKSGGGPKLKAVAERRDRHEESPAYCDKGLLVLWVIEALTDPERWQWFGQEGDSLRIVAAEGDEAEAVDLECPDRQCAGTPSESGNGSPKRRSFEDGFHRSLRIAGRACRRLTRMAG